MFDNLSHSNSNTFVTGFQKVTPEACQRRTEALWERGAGIFLKESRRKPQADPKTNTRA